MAYALECDGCLTLSIIGNNRISSMQDSESVSDRLRAVRLVIVVVPWKILRGVEILYRVPCSSRMTVLSGE